jgi:hypothetical protein
MPKARRKKSIGLKDLRVTRGGSAHVKGGSTKKSVLGTARKSGGTSTPTPTPAPTPTSTPTPS